MTSQKIKQLSPDYLGINPFINPDNPLDSQWQSQPIIYAESSVPPDPLRWRLSDTLDYNVAIISTPDTFLWRVLVTGTGNYPQWPNVGLWFIPSSIFIRAFQPAQWGFSECFVDMSRATIKSWRWPQVYTTYVTWSTINRGEDLTNAIRVASSNVLGTISVINNGFNINISTFTANTTIHYIAYQ